MDTAAGAGGVALTDDEVAAQRARAAAVALTWVGTPFHPNGRLKGIGSDCLTTLAGVAEECELTPHIEIPHYMMDQNLHRGEETYLDGVLRFCVEVPGPPERIPLPGDVVVWKFGRIFFHGAMVIRWPTIVHTYSRIGRVQEDDVTTCSYLNTVGDLGPDYGKPRPRKFFTFRAWAR